MIPRGKSGGPRTSGAGRRQQGPEAHTHIHAQDTERPTASIQERGEAVREEGDGTEMSEQQLQVGHQGRRKLDWGLSGRLCPNVGEAAPRIITGVLPVAGAGHLRWSLDEGRRSSSVICKQMEVGDMLSGCSQAGHPASLHLIEESRLEFP